MDHSLRSSGSSYSHLHRLQQIPQRISIRCEENFACDAPISFPTRHRAKSTIRLRQSRKVGPPKEGSELVGRFPSYENANYG